MAKEIKIVIERNGLKLVQHRQSFAGHLSPKGIIQRARETDYLPRRTMKTGINFYDCGLFYNDSDGFNEWDFQAESFYSSNGSGGLFIEPPGETIVRYLIDAVLSCGVENFDKTYYRMGVDYADHFRVFVIGDDFFIETAPGTENWSESGLTLTPEQLATENLTLQLAYGISFQIKVKGAGKNKITQANDPDADAVEFTPTNSDKYFFFPRLVTPSSVATSSNPPVNTTLISNHRVMPRTPFVFPDSPTYRLPSIYDWVKDSSPIEKYPRVLASIALMNDAAYSVRAIENRWNGTAWIETPAGAADYPPGEFFGASPDEDAFSLVATWTTNEPEYENLLVAVIKQGANYFYVWNTPPD